MRDHPAVAGSRRYLYQRCPHVPPQPASVHKAPAQRASAKTLAVRRGARAPAHPQFLRDIAPDSATSRAAPPPGATASSAGAAISSSPSSPSRRNDDYAPIVCGARGRRVNLQEPEKSLFLLKPTGQFAHGGGMVIHEGLPRVPHHPELAADGVSLRRKDDPQAGDADRRAAQNRHPKSAAGRSSRSLPTGRTAGAKT